MNEAGYSEDLLRTEHQRITNILESIRDPFISLDNAWCYRYINSAAESVLGLKREDLLGKDIRMVFSDPNAVRIYDRLSQVMKERVIISFEEYYEPFDRWMDIRAFPSDDGISVIFRDITEKKHIENELTESQRNLNRAQAVARLGNWKFLAEQNLLLWSDETYRMYGIPFGTPLTYELFLSRVHPEDRERVDKMWTEALSKGNYNIDHRIVVEDQIKWVTERIELEFDSDGILKTAFGIVQDITDRVLLEEELKRSEQSYHELADAMPQMVWIRTPEGKIIYRNKLYLDYSGPVDNEWEELVHPDDLMSTRENWKNAIGTGQAYENYYRLRRNDGAYRWHLARAVAIKDESGSVLKWYGTSTDIHEYKTLQKKMEETLIDLERSNKELEQFAYIASHDLQEPLRMVSSFVKLLERENKGRLDDRADERISFIVDGAKRMQALINGLLSYARITSKDEPYTTVDLNIILQDVLRDLKFLIEHSKAEIKIDPMPVIQANPLQMRQLFQNLISNAIKFSSRETPHVHIRSSSEENNDSWTISIKDNGIGINPEYFDKIFMIFQRLHERDKYTGEGIGLSICKKIVEQHGGQIWAESKEGHGSTFYFTIPR